MINILITTTPISQKIEILGHSDTGKEPCARVTSAFEMLANLMYKDRDQLEQSSGYSLLVTKITKQNRHQLDIGQAYFNNLQAHYPRTIKVENKEIK